MAHFISKAAIYTRSLFPNLFFAVVAAGVRNAADGKQVQWTVFLSELYLSCIVFVANMVKMCLNVKTSMLFIVQWQPVTKFNYI